MGKRRANGYWKDINNALHEARKIIEEHGFDELPSQQKLAELGNSTLNGAIIKHHGGFIDFREKMGYTPKRRKNGVWKSYDFIVAEVEKLKETHGWHVLPGKKILDGMGLSYIGNAITRYHGGFHAFREKMESEQITVEAGKWKDLEYVLIQAGQIMGAHEWDELPTSSRLYEEGYGNFLTAIGKYHGGMEGFRKLLGHERIMRKSGVWKDLNYAISEAEKAMRENGWDAFPSNQVLQRSGYSSLSMAVSTYHGGFHKFREELQKGSDRPTERDNLEGLLDDYVDGGGE